jgi:hypothetical protein
MGHARSRDTGRGAKPKDWTKDANEEALNMRIAIAGRPTPSRAEETRSGR